MSPDELQALIAAAAPGARVTITVVTIEVPSSGGATSTSAGVTCAPGAGSSASDRAREGNAVMPSPWSVPPELAGQAPAIMARLTPYTTQELADVLGVKRDTVSLWLRKGLLPGSSKLAGAGWRIPPSAVLALLSATVTHAAAETQSPSVATGARGRADARRAELVAERSAARAGFEAQAEGDCGSGIAPERRATAAGDPTRHTAPQPTDTPTAETRSGAPSDASVDPHSDAAPTGGRREVVDGFDLGSLGDWRQKRKAW